MEPLRALRRKLRADPDKDVQRLREGIKALELAAEKLVQDRLGRISPDLPAAAPIRRARAAAAHANLALYLGPEMACSREAATIGEALEAFIQD